jgi:hypothetical protein
MEISEATVIGLVQGQALTQQKVDDVIKRLDAAFPFLNTQHEKLDTRITELEKKSWLYTGASGVLGAIGGFAFSQFPSLVTLFRHK